MKLPPVSALLTDLYQLTMLQSYFEQGMTDTAVFEFFVRKLPAQRNYLMAAGLEQALSFLENLRFSDEELQWLRASGRFSEAFVDGLGPLRFSGDVHAMAEGRIFYPNEPILRITAPLPEAQLVETRLINLLHFQTLIASKATRAVTVAPNKLLVDFGLRRAHGGEAGLLAARACYLAGYSGAATVLAEPAFDIPIFGTMAHSFIMAHDDETQAFEHFAHAQPDNVVLLIDTYDTEAAAAKVVTLAPKLKQHGIAIKGVRLDSGDLAQHARNVRRILDRGGLAETTIFASGNLDEYALQTLVASGAPIDGFGLGTHMDTSSDAPSLDCAYKLQEYAGAAKRKRSEGKATWPGRKQVYRHYGDNGEMHRDIIATGDERQSGEPLLEAVMRNGQRLHPPTPLTTSRQLAADEQRRLPAPYLALDAAARPYPVDISDKLRDLTRTVNGQHP